MPRDKRTKRGKQEYDEYKRKIYEEIKLEELKKKLNDNNGNNSVKDEEDYKIIIKKFANNFMDYAYLFSETEAKGFTSIFTNKEKDIIKKIRDDKN